MSQENVEIVRRIFDAWASGDWSIGERVSRPACRVRHRALTSRPSAPTSALMRIRAYWRDFLEQWERLTFEAKRIEAVGDTVLAHVVQHAKGRASGIEGDLAYFMLFTFRGEARSCGLEAVMDRRGSPRSRGAVGARRSRRLLSLRDTARAMSQENVEIVRDLFDAMERGATYEPLVESVGLRASRSSPAARRSAASRTRGRKVFGAWIAEIQASFDRFDGTSEATFGTWATECSRWGRSASRQGEPYRDRAAHGLASRRCETGSSYECSSIRVMHEALEAVGLSE